MSSRPSYARPCAKIVIIAVFSLKAASPAVTGSHPSQMQLQSHQNHLAPNFTKDSTPPEGEQIDPHSITIPLRPGRGYGLFDSIGGISHTEARPTSGFLDLRVDAPARQHHAASHLALTAVWSRDVGRTA